MASPKPHQCLFSVVSGCAGLFADGFEAEITQQIPDSEPTMSARLIGPGRKSLRKVWCWMWTVGWSGLQFVHVKKKRTVSPCPPCDAFFNADHDELIEIYIFFKKDTPPAFMVEQWHGRSKSECENNIKWGPKRCEMMTGFQIWPQNSNRITFDPLLDKNCRKLAKYLPHLAFFQSAAVINSARWATFTRPGLRRTLGHGDKKV